MSGDKRIKGVVFDLDGTLVHSRVDFRVMKARMFEVLIREGIPSSLLMEDMTTSKNLARVHHHLMANGMEHEWARVNSRIIESMNRTEMEAVDGTLAVDGARKTLSWIRRSGSSIGLLTRGSREYAQAVLHHAGLDVGFDAMVCRDDFPESEAKPNGKAMTRMADMLGLHLRECLLVGDHLMDLQCASSASVPFVGVLSGAFKEEDWRRHGCDVFIKDVGALPVLLSNGNLYFTDGP